MLNLFLIALIALAVVYLPAMLVLSRFRISGSMLLGLAPLWSAGMLTFTSIVFAVLQIQWSLLNFFLFSVVAGGVAELIALGLFGKREAEETVFFRIKEFAQSGNQLFSVGLCFLIFVGAVLLWLPAVWEIPAYMPPQHNDSTFHLAAVMSIVQSGDASPFSAFSTLYGLTPVKVTYPAVWHQVASLLATEQTVVQVSKSMQLAISVIWLINIALLAKEVLPTHRYASYYALVVAQLIPVYPVYYFTHLPLWANSIGVAMVPGALLSFLLGYRKLRAWYQESKQHKTTANSQLRSNIITLLSVGLGTLGLTATYPPATFALLTLVFGGLIVSQLRLFSMQFSWRLKLLISGGIGVFLILGLFWIVNTDSIKWLLQRTVELDWTNATFKLWAIFMLSPAGGGTALYKAILAILGLLILTGVVISWKEKRIRWVSISWLLMLMLVLGTLFPLGIITQVTGLWYYGSYRLMPFLAVPSVILACIALEALVNQVANALKASRAKYISDAVKTAVGGKPRLLVVVMVFSLIVAGAAQSWDVRYARTKQLYKPARSAEVFMADEAELKMIFGLREKLIDGKLLLGEASTGAALVYITTGIPVAYKQVAFGSVVNDNPTSAYLAKNFKWYRHDPQVCEIVQKYNIGYFYMDRSQVFNEKEQKERAEGLFGIKPDPADFELIAKGGTAEVYRFKGCEPKERE